MIDLHEQDRVAICALAEQHLPSGTEMWAYGSRVKGTNYDASDLNLIVHTAEEYRIKVSSFDTALRDSNIPIFVQPLDWQSIPEYFRTNILQCYEVLWTAPSSHLVGE